MLNGYIIHLEMKLKPRLAGVLFFYVFYINWMMLYGFVELYYTYVVFDEFIIKDSGIWLCFINDCANILIYKDQHIGE